MKVLVCVRAVPLSESSFKLNADGTFYDETELDFQVNEFDLFGVEEAVRLKEKFKDVEITILSVGRKSVEDQIKKAMAIGADSGIRIELPDANQRDALTIASLIANWARDKNFDLIFCGVMSEDLQRAQVGPMLAELLKIPSATTVVSLTLEPEQRVVVCERELEGGLREKIQLPLPCLLTTQMGLNTVRYASLSNVLRIKKMDIPVVSPQSPGPENRSEKILRVFFPERTLACEFLEGSLEKVAEQLLERVKPRLRMR